MPVVPTLPIDAVQQHVAQSLTATPDSFGAVQGQEISQVGQAGMGIGTAMTSDAIWQQNMANRAEVREALSNFQNDTGDYLADNILSKQGKDAIGKIPQMRTDVSQIQNSYSDGLSNPRAQAMFNQLAPAVLTRATNMARRHELQQTQVYNNQTIDQENVSDINTAIADPENPQTTAQAAQTIKANGAARYPGSPEQAQASVATGLNTLYTGIVNKVASYNPARAMAFLENNKDNILPEDYAKLYQSTLNQVKTAAATHITSTLMMGDPSQAAANIAAITDPETQALVRSQYEAQYSAKTAQASLDAANKDAANAQAVIGYDGTTPVSLPPDMPPAQQAQLLAAANDRLQAQQNNTPIQTDRKVFNNLVQQAANDPDGFLRRPLTPYLSSLSDEDWKGVMELRTGLAKDREGTVEKATSLDSVNRVFTDGIRSIPQLSTDDDNGKPLPPGPALQERMRNINAFRQDFDNRLNTQFPDPKDRTPENAQSILDKMVTNRVVEKGWISNTTMPQGMVDENPTLDHTTGTWNKTLEPKFSPAAGTNLFYDYNSDRTSAKVYDKNGQLIGNWSSADQSK